ncbi:MAG: ParB/RepB/Spo0J family partition protein [Chloroflexi bacterium]|nr:MAG: ParB/RepB/Spo0J family partition protein [Chloroflexota bacterium]
MTQRRGLGRGLESLIPAAEEETPAGLREVPIDRISPNPWQPRVDLARDQLQELADSIREHGLIQPLIVTATQEGYQLIAGERRWRAARLAGLDTVPVIVKEASDRAKLELALVENLQRTDLNPLEAAMAYNQLIQEFGLTHAEVAERVGKSRVTITKALRLLRLPDGVKQALVAGDISEGHADALVSLDNEQLQLQIVDRIRYEGLTVRQTEDLVRRLREGQPEPATQTTRREQDPYIQALESEFREALGTKVNLYRTERGGRLVIHFYSDEELQAIYDTIVGG